MEHRCSEGANRGLVGRVNQCRLADPGPRISKPSKLGKEGLDDKGAWDYEKGAGRGSQKPDLHDRRTSIRAAGVKYQA